MADRVKQLERKIMRKAFPVLKRKVRTLKGWKKVGKDTWLDTSKERHRMIIVDINTSGTYNVILGSAGGERLLLNTGLTKSQALMFAKQYMKTH